MLQETVEGRVVQARAASIHGAVFYEVVLETGEGMRRLRFQDSFLPDAPVEGEGLRFELLLGNVTAVERVPG